VKANNDTRVFFEAIAEKIAHWYAPDMGLVGILIFKNLKIIGFK
jgi:hypothetical protein